MATGKGSSDRQEWGGQKNVKDAMAHEAADRRLFGLGCLGCTARVWSSFRPLLQGVSSMCSTRNQFYRTKSAHCSWRAVLGDRQKPPKWGLDDGVGDPTGLSGHGISTDAPARRGVRGRRPYVEGSPVARLHDT